MPFHRIASLFLLCALPAAVRLPAAQLPQTQGGSLFNRQTQDTYTVAGTVLNAVTGEPIRAALVQAPTGARLTGPDGKFQFEKLPPGQYGFSVRKPGYFNDQELAQGYYRDPLIVVGPNLQPIVLKLTPESVIYGRITGTDGEPVENLQVQAYVSRVVSGRRHWELHSGQPTDDTGQFRIAELRAGTYFIRVGPGSQPLAHAGNQPKQPEGYPATFYPGARDLGTAAPIQVEPGHEYRADFSLQPAPLYKVSGSMSGIPMGPNGNSMGVGFQFLGQEGEGMAAGIRFSPQTGLFNADSVFAGSYTLIAISQDPVNNRQLTARMPLTVNADVAGVRLNLGPAISIPVNVRTELTKPAPQANDAVSLPNNRFQNPFANVYLEARDLEMRNQNPGANFEGRPGDQTYAVRNVQPGTYRAQITPNGSWYVESARCGSVDLLREDLQVSISGGVEPIDIVLRDDFAGLHGTISSNGQSAAGIVLLIPVATPRLAKLAFAQQDGTFNLGLLAPGDYRVLALDRVDDLEYAEPDGLRDFSAAMQPVRLSPNQQGNVTLELVRRQK